MGLDFRGPYNKAVSAQRPAGTGLRSGEDYGYKSTNVPRARENRPWPNQPVTSSNLAFAAGGGRVAAHMSHCQLIWPSFAQSMRPLLGKGRGAFHR